MGVPPVYPHFPSVSGGCGIPHRQRCRVRIGGYLAADSNMHILLCLIVKILPETLIYKAELSKQAEPFLLPSQGQNTWRGHARLGVGSVGVLGAPSSDQGELGKGPA